MGKYVFTNGNGRAAVTDVENAVTVEWTPGAFNDTQHVTTPAAPSSADGGALALKYARILQEIGEFVANEHPELL